jgi:hypothetical protein
MSFFYLIHPQEGDCSVCRNVEQLKYMMSLYLKS